MMSEPPRRRVLVIDDEPELSHHLEIILRRHGFDVWAPALDMRNGAKAVLALATRYRPHVVIMDLRLLHHHTDDRIGLTLVRKFPAAGCILYSNWMTLEVIRMAHSYNPDIRCVGKQESPELLVREVTEAADAVAAAPGRPRIQATLNCAPAEIARALFPSRADIPPSIVEDVLHQLFPEERTLDLAMLNNRALSSRPASRGRSLVYKANFRQRVPCVVKLGPAEKIRREAANYRRHVYRQIGGNFHSEQDDCVLFWDLGATAYRFLGSEEGLPTFAEFYEEQSDADRVLRPMRHFFNTAWRRHYAHYAKKRALRPGSLVDLYARPFHLNRKLEDGVLRARVAAAGSALGYGPADPLVWLDEHRAEPDLPDLRLAVTHGDLHGDNLFVDGDHAWAIDFERTGPGHILRDFAELEVDILTRLAPVPADDPAVALAFYQTAVSLTPDAIPARVGGWAGTGDGQKALAVLAGLRQLSREVTGRWRTEEHLWALLFDAVFLLSLASPESPQWQRALLLSIVLCRQLDEMQRTSDAQTS